MEITVKTNGYEISKELQTMVKRFETVAERFFPNWECNHFYYGDTLVMTRIKGDGQHADFNISKNRVSFNGHTLIMTNAKKCESMTYNDECFDGKLLELAE